MAQIVPVTESMSASTARCLARAFREDPLMAWVYPDAERRLAQVEQWWDLCLSVTVGRTPVDAATSDGIERGVAIWTRPGQALFDAETGARLYALLTSQLGADVDRALSGLMSITTMQPAEDHLYLFGLGVDPDRQSTGVGRALVEHRLGTETPTLAYLESSNIRNVPFYERLGFEVIGEVTLPDGPVIRGMRREPSQTATG